MWDSYAEDGFGRISTTTTSMSMYDTTSRDSGYADSENLASFDSCSPMEDEFFETFSEFHVEEKPVQNLPEGFNNLICKPLRERNSLDSNITDNSTPVPQKKVAKRFSYLEEEIEVKRTRISFSDEDFKNARPALRRSISATEESIMCAVQKSVDNHDLIGDFTTDCCLPLTKSRHSDLKAISPGTLAQLINGQFRETVASFKIIDCRYPYEYQGGHIVGAQNIYTREACAELLDNNIVENGKRNILIFHCEFSAERGPNLYRYLRSEDRQRNEDTYPFLTYPEIYLLEGGYKNFFKQYSNLCAPVAYTSMLHPAHKDDLKHFRQKSKTWNSDLRSSKPQKLKNFRRLML